MNTVSFLLRGLKVPKGQQVNILAEETLRCGPRSETGLSFKAITNAGERFVTKARAAMASAALAPGDHDIYVSVYGNQGDLILPLSFFKLVAETELKVTIDYNS